MLPFLICPNNFLAQDVQERERARDELEKEGQRDPMVASVFCFLCVCVNTINLNM